MFHMEQYRLRRSSVLIISGFDKLNISRFRVKLKLHAAEIARSKAEKFANNCIVSHETFGEHLYIAMIVRFFTFLSLFSMRYAKTLRYLCFIILKKFRHCFYDLSVWVACFAFIL